jgi:pSer/pThr/pTyr-binding forkhead associated (FHA) protein
MVLGRHSTADVRLPLPDVSRRHCRFVYTEGSWQVFDLDSLNGVYVNGERLGKATLHDGDLLGIGGFLLKVEFNPTAPAASPPLAAAAEPPAIFQPIRDTLPQSPVHLDHPHRKAS